MESDNQVVLWFRADSGTIEPTTMAALRAQNHALARCVTSRMHLCDLTPPPIRLHDSSQSNAQKKHVALHFVVSDTFALPQDADGTFLMPNEAATRLLHHGNRVHQQHDALICGDALLVASFCAVHPRTGQPQCSNCPIDLRASDVDALLRGAAHQPCTRWLEHVSAADRCPRHKR